MTTGAALALRVALVLAYAALAHAASVRGASPLAALALGVLTLLMLLAPLLQRRGWAWALLALAGAALWWLRDAPALLLPLLLVPPAFVALAGWMFARTLRPGRIPLLTRLVSAMERVGLAEMPAELRRYSRRLTALWAGALWLLAALNLALALIARPRGLLAQLGVDAPLSVTQAQWSLLANWGNYGLIALLLAGEFAWRWRAMPARRMPPAEFARRAASLGPAFWRDFLR